MYFNKKLWSLTKTVRPKIIGSITIGLIGSVIGMSRLLMLGWLIGELMAGQQILQVWPLVLGTLVLMASYSLLEYQRLLLTQRTAAIVQGVIRTKLFDQLIDLGPAYFSNQRSGEISNTIVEGVEQLEIYFGQYLPQLFVAGITPFVIFAVVSFIDLPVACLLLVASLFTLFAPSLFQRWDSKLSMARSVAYRAFASEFLDALQGLVTLKAFGQSKARENKLAKKAHELFQTTMWLMATNSLARGITDIGITLGAASALTVSAYRVSEGLMSYESLLLILLLGVEVFKPLRELRSLMHAGMLAQSAAKQIFEVLEAKSETLETQALDKQVANVRLKDMSISFENVDFAYAARSSARVSGEDDKDDTQTQVTNLVHNQLSFAVADSEQVGVVGSSGGGKSTILNLLLRFYQPQQGSIKIGGTDIQDIPVAQLRSLFSVVSQSTYLFHASIKENLLLGSEHSSGEEIIEAAKAANAHQFIMQLEYGYDTVIGEQGTRLSGGQRQRIAIARALLRDAPILILDEALSSVDAKNETQIQSALNKLMQGRTTLIFAHRLGSIINCDKIILLSDGAVAEQGTHAQLINKQAKYARLMASQLSINRASNAFSKVEHESKSEIQLATVEDNIKRAGLEYKSTETEQDNILNGENYSWRNVLVMLLSFAKDYKGRLFLTFTFGVVRVFSYIGVSVFSALAAAAVKTGADYSVWTQLLIVSAITAALVHWFESWVAHDMAFRMLSKMRINLFRKLEQLAPAFMVKHRSGDLINLATHDIEMIEYFFAHTIAPVFVAVIVPSAVLLMLASFSPILAIALVPFIVLVFAMPIMFRTRIDSAAAKARNQLARLSAHSIENLQGLAELLNYQATDKRRTQYKSLIKEHNKQRLSFFKISAGQGVLVEFITLSSALLLLVIAAPIASSGTFNVVYLPLIALAAVMAFLPVIEVADVGRQLSETLAATRRLMQVELTKAVVVDAGSKTAVFNQSKVGHRALSVHFKGIRFSYSSMFDAPVINDLNLDIEAGTKVALVGASGAGKSTIAHLLMRFWDPQQGGIWLEDKSDNLTDKVNIQDIALEQFRGYVSIVAQDTYLFNDTIKENLLMAKPKATDEELFAAVEAAQLSDFITKQPQGINTVVGERGFSLSGGQCQRLSIARAFLRDAPVLILDEATSHLDAISEAAVHTALAKLMKHRTTLVIAHRLASIEDADKIVVLDQGRVLEQGTHQQLLTLNGQYASLLRFQHEVIAA